MSGNTGGAGRTLGCGVVQECVWEQEVLGRPCGDGGDRVAQVGHCVEPTSCRSTCFVECTVVLVAAAAGVQSPCAGELVEESSCAVVQWAGTGSLAAWRALRLWRGPS